MVHPLGYDFPCIRANTALLSVSAEKPFVWAIISRLRQHISNIRYIFFMVAKLRNIS